MSTRNAVAQARWYARQKNTGLVYSLLLDGLLYVGGTTNSLKKRLWQHRAGCVSSTKGKSMDETIITELEQVSSPDLLKERVEFWIDKLHPDLVPKVRGGYKRKKEIELNKDSQGPILGQ